jgi:hypothetical protein
MYFAGLGVPPNVVEAYFWLYVILANSSPRDGYNPAAIDTLDTVARQMTPAQIARAQELARQWQARKEHEDC